MNLNISINRKMKAKSDRTISSIMMMYSLFFISILFIKGFNLTIFGWCWILGWSLLVVLAAWKVESYEIIDGKLIKRNLLGLFSRERELNTMKKYSKNLINTDYPTNPST
ncbi:hypothetical protein GXP67_04155 [Rhodocytophaga rosea]|uniref:Uncharacterized protein n=1 Tax=Rhodocytophaga rosea TaxID=2704465 RepID=A0A6C0GDD5_9BACT|nr:hypothetical protein [Rhodocytophaga rosea]QHT65918.1 hypothetical protein GXP67_04155 [Rhodocytophaga rosea]